MIEFRSAALTHPGRKRPNNEDFITFFEPSDKEVLLTSGSIYVLADGVGGASKGEKASQYAAQKILHDYYQHSDIPIKERLALIIRSAGNDIFDYAEQQDQFMQMATTVVVAVFRQNKLQVAHVGDSRAYLIRQDNVTQLTRDHSTVGEMVRDGILTEEEAMHFEGRNPLSRSLGGQRDVQVDITDEIIIEPGDSILLASDGFSNYATRKDIDDLLQQGEPDEVVYRLVDYANQCGGSDNISVIVIKALDQDKKSAIASRGQKPQPVVWDSMATQPQNFSYKGKRKRSLPEKRKQRNVILPVSILAGVVILLVAVFFVWPGLNNLVLPGVSVEISNEPIILDNPDPSGIADIFGEEEINQPSQADSDISDPDSRETESNLQQPLTGDPLGVNEESQTPVTPVEDGEEPVDIAVPTRPNLPDRLADGFNSPLGWCQHVYDFQDFTSAWQESNKDIHPGCIERNSDLWCYLNFYFEELIYWIDDLGSNNQQTGLLIYAQEIIATSGDYRNGKDEFRVIEGNQVRFWLPHIFEMECDSAGGEFERYEQ